MRVSPTRADPLGELADDLLPLGLGQLAEGLLVGLLADPKMIVYLGIGKNPVNISGSGLFYGHAHQLPVQLGAAVTIIIWDGLVTFLLLKGIGDRKSVV